MISISKRLSKIRLIIAITIALMMSSYNLVVFANVNIKDNNTKAGVLIDQATGKVLFESNKDEILPQASVTKLMTYYVIRDFIKEKNIPLTEKITVDADFSKVPEDGTQLRLKKGDIITVEDLISSLLIMSANDSAIQLEKMVEESSGKNFLNIMNSKAKEIGLNNTNYINTSGLTEEVNGKKVYNTTTAYETAILSKKIIDDYPDTLKITSKKSFTFGKDTYSNTNKLLGNKNAVDGLKTGFTSEAGYCLASTESVTQTIDGNKPFRLIAVTLGSDTDSNRTNVNSKILSYGEKNFENRKVVKKEDEFNVKSEYHKGGNIPSSVKDDVYYLLSKDSKVETIPSLKDGLKNSIKKGDVIGKLTIKINDITLEEDLYANADIKRISIFKRVAMFFSNLFN